jgi:hypothetical protein
MTRNLFDNNFDPYDALVELNERMNRMEHAHNLLAHAFQQTEQEVSVLLKTIQAQQQTIISMGELFANKTLFDLDQMNKK